MSQQSPSPQDQKAAATPSGPAGDNPATAGPGHTAVDSNTPENKQGALDPSAPGNTGTTPGSVGEKG
jgi:hypothetical protein